MKIRRQLIRKKQKRAVVTGPRRDRRAYQDTLQQWCDDRTGKRVITYTASTKFGAGHGTSLLEALAACHARIPKSAKNLDRVQLLLHKKVEGQEPKLVGMTNCATQFQAKLGYVARRGVRKNNGAAGSEKKGRPILAGVTICGKCHHRKAQGKWLTEVIDPKKLDDSVRVRVLICPDCERGKK